MGEAVQSLEVSASDQFATTRRKTRRKTQAGIYTGNLVVFAHAQTQPSNPTEFSEGKNVREHSGAHNVANGFTNDSSDNHPQNGSDSTRSVVSLLATSGQRKKVGILILLALASGVLLNTIWTSNTISPSGDNISEGASVEPFAPEAIHTESIPQAKVSPVVSDADPAETEIVAVATSKIADEKLQRIQLLHAQNEDLLAQVNELNRESAEMASEMLRLERSLAEIKLRSQPAIETRTVYNFVNRATGNNRASGNDFVSQNDISTTQNNGDQYQDQLYYESQLYSDDQYNYEEELISYEQEQLYYDNQGELYDATEDAYNNYAPEYQQQLPLVASDQYSEEGPPYDELEDPYDDDPQNLRPYE